MNNVPLINSLSINDINAALIAIKRQLLSKNGTQEQDVDVNVDVNIAQNSLYCAANSKVIKGAELFQGCSIKVLFTSAITGSNITTPLTINYNNVDITVKVGKNGSLADFVAYDTGSGYVYCQAYTTLELLFDGNNFVIMGNPVVISNSDYTVYTDGSITYTKNKEDSLLGLRPQIFKSQITVTTDSQGLAEISQASLPIGYYDCQYILRFFNGTSVGFRYYVQVLGYDGGIVVNQEISFTLLYIPSVLDIAQQGL